MSKFNKGSVGTKTINKAGGEAYGQSAELELASILLTSFAGDQFYRSENETYNRLKELIGKVDKKFAAQAAVYARTQFGMRSVTHVTASELAKHISGAEWAKDFFGAIVYRPDDMCEILAYHLSKNGKVPNSMKKGFAAAFAKFNDYSLAKYRGEGKDIKLVDVVNMVHPKAGKNAAAIESLVKGELKSFDTWESELSKAGTEGKTEEEKAKLKKAVWVNLLNEGKIGIFAILRNLRNIIEQAPEALPKAIETLTNEAIIKKSLILPFRFKTAYDEIEKLDGSKNVRSVLVALNKAVDLSINNVPKFDGETLVALDMSGSMRGKPSEIGSLFSAVLVKSNNADFMVYDSNAEYVNLNPMDSTITITKAIPFNGGGTDFHCIFQKANKKYDRIIILSDMQAWIGHYTPTRTYNAYKERTGATPFIYSFDLQGYGSMQFPEKNVFCLAGFSDKIFDIMSFSEKDKNALINEIKKVKFVAEKEEAISE